MDHIIGWAMLLGMIIGIIQLIREERESGKRRAHNAFVEVLLRDQERTKEFSTPSRGQWLDGSRQA